MATSYSDLVRKTPIWLYAQNRDITDEMPALIKDAEDQIYLRFDHDLFQTVIPGLTLSAGQTDLDLSSHNVLEVRSIRLKYRKDTQWTPIERRDLEMLSMLYSTNRPARPRYYATYGSQDMMRLFPTPNADVDIEVTANVAPPYLAATTQETNIITEKYPRVIERAVLRQGAIFMKNQQDAATYEAEMEAALQEANDQIMRRRRDETDVRFRETSNTGG